SYEGLTRVETYEYPKDALREALLNAVAHKDYTGPYPIQIERRYNNFGICREIQSYRPYSPK
ncbi:MAG: hypothetical protein LBK18_01820, partial [Prevotellaceae bacterium]|nr:hypothetical protein [Prevotellaceae bacterium]